MQPMIRVVILTALSSVLLAHTTWAQGNPEVQTRESQAGMTPAAAIERLKEGNRRFVANATKQRDWSAKSWPRRRGGSRSPRFSGAWTHERPSRSR